MARMRGVLWLIALEAVAFSGLLVVALDVWAHKRVEELGGTNVWGYRGAVANHKQPNELRIVFVGGTRAFGWGSSAGGTVAAQVRWQLTLTLDRPGLPARPIVAINLGRLDAATASYRETIERFASLQPDYICLYDDLGVPAEGDASNASGIFESTGYAPILPLVLREKGMALRFGDVARGYQRDRSPDGSTISWTRRSIGAVLEMAGNGLAAADRFFSRTMRRGRRPAGSGVPARVYAEAMTSAIEAAHRSARGVVVVLSPTDTAEQTRNWSALEAWLATDQRQQPWLRVVDLGDLTELYDPDTRLDGWNFAPGGVVRASQAITPALLDLIATQ